MRIATRLRIAVLVATVGLTVAASVAIVGVSWHPSARADPGWTAGARGPLLERTRGTLQGIDARAGTLTLSTTGETVHVRVDETTTIFVDGRSTDISALHVGQNLCATWEPGAVRPTAQWVEPCED